eukprot:20879-Eustigmatos_ZCMA.PRE.1
MKVEERGRPGLSLSCNLDDEAADIMAVGCQTIGACGACRWRGGDSCVGRLKGACASVACCDDGGDTRVHTDNPSTCELVATEM